MKSGVRKRLNSVSNTDFQGSCSSLKTLLLGVQSHFSIDSDHNRIGNKKGVTKEPMDEVVPKLNPERHGKV